MESKKFNFVYEKITEEDRKFIESFQIEKATGRIGNEIMWNETWENLSR